MEWSGEATVIAQRKHGEHAVILDVMSHDQGRIAGMVPGGASRKRAAMLQPGNRVSLHWRARVEGQLGTFAVEPLQARPGLLGDGLALAGLNATTALLLYALPERDPHPQLVQASEKLWDAMDAGRDWGVDYLHWEILLLRGMGFGLNLGQCAVTGSQADLAYVSPRTGRAVSREGAGEYAARLMILPEILGGAGGGLAEGLTLTGHFLNRYLAQELVGRPIPAARDRLVARLQRPPK